MGLHLGSMAELALRPRSPTELVDAAIQLYRREPLQFIVAVGLAYAPFVLLLPFIGFTPTVFEDAAANTVTIVGVVALGMVVYLLSSGMTILLANELYLGRPANLGRALATVGRRFGSLLGAIVAVGIVLMLVALPIGLGAALLGGPIAAIFGVFALMFGEMYLVATFVAVKQTVLIEGISSTAALSRSASLTQSLRGHVLGTMALVILLNFALAIAATMVTSMIPSPIVQGILQFVVTTVVYPLIGIVQTVLYYDLRIRREGFDIEYLASAFEPPPATT
jgi:hypothetical protein